MCDTISITIYVYMLSVQPQSFLEWARTSFEQPIAEFYTILLEEHLQVALEMLEVGFCSLF
jgi:hypothetical protein